MVGPHSFQRRKSLSLVFGVVMIGEGWHVGWDGEGGWGVALGDL